MINLELNEQQRNLVLKALEMLLQETDFVGNQTTSAYFRDQFAAESFSIRALKNTIEDTPEFLPSDDQLKAKILSFLRQGQKIEAIKYVRQYKQLGLKEAKDYVEQYQTTN